MNAPDSAYAAFLRTLAAMEGQRNAPRNWTLYETLKRDFVRQFPEVSPDEYARAMQAIARAAGV